MFHHSIPNKWYVLCEKPNINIQKILPLHPSYNPTETFIKPLVKTMKIPQNNNKKRKHMNSYCKIIAILHTQQQMLLLQQCYFVMDKVFGFTDTQLAKNK